MVEGIERTFPLLAGAQWRVSSSPDDLYNCIAWAVESCTDWWWPMGLGRTFWPEGVPRVETLEAFRAAFGTLGYVDCATTALEPGFQKIALFAKTQGIVTHASRQLGDGRWTSKLGKMEDIEHELHDLEGIAYGSVVLVMKRPMLAR